MSRTFAYARVSTTGQSVENQIQEITAAGFTVEPHRLITETVSGSTPMARRAGFAKLLDRLEPGDVLVATKLDRLGRDALDVSATVKKLAERGVRLHCLALGGVDLTSSAGTMTLHVLNAVAQFERDLLIERTQAGLQRAKAQGKAIGRKPKLTPQQQQAVRQALDQGETVSAIARRFGVSRQTVMRARGHLNVG